MSEFSFHKWIKDYQDRKQDTLRNAFRGWVRNEEAAKRLVDTLVAETRNEMYCQGLSCKGEIEMISQDFDYGQTQGVAVAMKVEKKWPATFGRYVYHLIAILKSKNRQISLLEGEVGRLREQMDLIEKGILGVWEDPAKEEVEKIFPHLFGEPYDE